MAFRLRYNDRTLELNESPFTVGRNPSCQLTIDGDALISRKHATFTVTPNGVVVDDHDSRNGVIVNGARIENQALLRSGDTILIGVQEFTLAGDKRGNAAASKKLAATGLHRAVTSAAATPKRATVDFVTIGGHVYAVIPKADYLTMRKTLTAPKPAPRTPAKRAKPKKKR